MQRPTILIMNRVYPPVRGATGRLLQDFARVLVKEGWHVTIVTSGPVAEETREVGIRIIRVKAPEKPESMFGYIWVWFKMFLIAFFSERRHLIVTMSDPPLIVYAGAVLSKLKKCRHINWCHDIYPEVVPALGITMPDFLGSFFKRLRRKAMVGATHIVVCGRCMKNYLVSDGLDENKISVVANWPESELSQIDDHRSVEKPSVAHMRPFEKQVKSKQRFRVLYAGNIGLVHPTDVIIDAAERLQEAGHDIEFLFVGTGPRFDELAEERSRRGLDNMRFLPYQPISKLWEVLEGGDMHLISMKGEAAGYVVPSKLYAALSVGRPCIFIGPEDCETARVILEYKAGVVIPQGDVEHLVASIILFRKNGDAWFSSHKGALKARDAFTSEVSLDKLISIMWGAVKNDLGA